MSRRPPSLSSPQSGPASGIEPGLFAMPPWIAWAPAAGLGGGRPRSMPGRRWRICRPSRRSGRPACRWRSCATGWRSRRRRRASCGPGGARGRGICATGCAFCRRGRRWIRRRHGWPSGGGQEAPGCAAAGWRGSWRKSGAGAGAIVEAGAEAFSTHPIFIFRLPCELPDLQHPGGRRRPAGNLACAIAPYCRQGEPGTAESVEGSLQRGAGGGAVARGRAGRRGDHTPAPRIRRSARLHR